MVTQKKKTKVEEAVQRLPEYERFTANAPVTITGGYWETAKWKNHWRFVSYCKNLVTGKEWLEIYNTRLAKNIAVALDNVKPVPVKSTRKRRTTK